MSKELSEQQISAGGRWLCDQSADACGVNRDDNWKVYGSEYIDEFRGAYNAAVKASPAIANKATEEGDRERFEAWYFHKFGAQKMLGDSDQYHMPSAQGAWQAWQAAIAADRASRQVANKAEVDPVAPTFNYLLRDRLVSVDVSTCDEDAAHRIFAELTGDTASDGTTLIAIETSRNFASPPATTGASIVSAGNPIYQVNAAGASGSWRNVDKAQYDLASDTCRRIVTESVGASTVLTDELIIEDARDWGLLDIQDGGRIDRSALISFVREVAAQAGQVAVPGQDQIEWGHDLQVTLIEASKDEAVDEDARQVMAQAACLLAELTGRAAQLDGGQGEKP